MIIEIGITAVIIVAVICIILNSFKKKVSGDCGCGNCSSKHKNYSQLQNY